MKASPVDRTFDPLSNGMHNSFLTKMSLKHYSTEATIGQTLYIHNWFKRELNRYAY